ncbi:MAG: fibronectin type III domain-containing protein, partial [Bacteroidales bacterium]|nr:fibronectin type III domain-containing protein [Candidatus Colimorpha onthohippi]
VRTTKYVFQHLDTNAEYDFYLRAYCGNCDAFSPDTLVRYRTYATPTDTIHAPYYDNFDLYAYSLNQNSHYVPMQGASNVNNINAYISATDYYTTDMYRRNTNGYAWPYGWQFPMTCGGDEWWRTDNYDGRFPKMTLMSSTANAVEVYDATHYWKGVMFGMGSARNRAAMAIMPAFRDTVTDLQLRLKYRFRNQYHGKVYIGLTSAVNDVNNFIPVRELLPTQEWTMDSTSFYGFVPADQAHKYRMAIRYNYDSYDGNLVNDGFIYLDSIAVTRLPECRMPNNLRLVLDNEQLHQGMFDLAWDGPEGAIGYAVRLEKNGEPGESGTSRISNTANITFSGLVSGSQYTAYVRTICAVGDTSDEASLLFTAPCRGEDLPYVENFDSYNVAAGYFSTGTTAPARFADMYDRHTMPNCWTFDKNTNNFTSIYTYNVNNYPQGFLSDMDDLQLTHGSDYSKALVLKTTGGHATAILPMMALPLDSLKITFYYRNHSAYEGTNPMQLGYVTGASTDSPQWFQLGDDYPLVDDYTKVTYDLSRTERIYPADAQLAIRYKEGGSTNYFLAIDSVRVERAPHCADLTGLAVQAVMDGGVTLKWDAVPGASYEVVARNEGVAEARKVVAVNRATVDGLTPGVRYRFDVRVVCGAADTGEAAFIYAMPLCGSASLPYVEHFDLATNASQYSTSPLVVPADYATSTHAQPNCWRFAGMSNSQTSYPQAFIVAAGNNSGATYTYQGSNGALVMRNDGADSRRTVASLPRFASQTFGGTMPLDSLFITFSARAFDESKPGSLQIGYMTNPDDASTFQPLQTINTLRHDYQTFTFDYLTSGTRFESGAVAALRYTGVDANSAVMVDEFEATQSSECKQPRNAVVATTAANSVTIGWNDNGNAAKYRVVYGEHPFYPGDMGGRTLYGTTPSALQVTGLDANPEYDFYLADSCACSKLWSPWVKLTAHTACAPVALPYVENFDSYTSDIYGGDHYINYPAATYSDVPCWTTVYQPEGAVAMPFAKSGYYAAGGYGLSWITSVGSGDPLARYYYSAGRSLALKSKKSPNTQLSTANAVYAVSPMFASNADSMRMDFRYRPYSNLPLKGTLQVGVMSSPYNTTSFTPLAMTESAIDHSYWRDVHVDLTTLRGTPQAAYRYVAFRYSCGDNDVDATAFIDDVSIERISDCEPPLAEVAEMASVSAKLQWLPNGNASMYQLQVNLGAANGTVVADVADIAGAATSYTVGGLSSSTAYYYKMRAYCGGAWSEWSDVRMFRTPCGGAPMPYSENFDSYENNISQNAYYPTASHEADYMPSCWSFPGVDVNLGNNPRYYPQAYLTSTTVTWPNSDAVAEASQHLALKSYNATTAAVAVLPPFGLHASLANIKFYYRNYSSSYTGQLQLGYTTSLTDPTKFRPVKNVIVNGGGVGVNETYLPKKDQFTVATYDFANAGLAGDTTYYIAFRFDPRNNQNQLNVVYID